MSKMEILVKGTFAACLIMFGFMPWLLMLPMGGSELREKSLGRGEIELDDKEYASLRV
jgi:hypothetical protein